MKKIMFIGLALTALSVLAPKTINAAFESNINQEVIDMFESNIDIITAEYTDVYNETWNATTVDEVVDIYNELDERIGYLVIFDVGYIAYRKDMSIIEMSNDSYPYFYHSKYSSKEKLVYSNFSFNGYENVVACNDDYNTSNIYYPLEDYYLKSGFEIRSSMVQIPYFNEVYDSSDWGNYKPICFGYGGTHSGGVLSAMALMYTLKTNGIKDITPYQTSYTAVRTRLSDYCLFDYFQNPTVSPQDLSYGINKYLSDDFGGQYSFSLVIDVDTYNPAVTFYYNNNPIQSADYCLRVGYASLPNFWIFKYYYDIVMADSTNFFIDEYNQPMFWFNDDLTPFFIVNQDYRHEMFQYFEGKELLKL